MAFDVQKLAPDLGALIGGVDPFQPIEVEQQAILRSLLAKHKVLVFEGARWGPSELLRMAQVFGRLPESLWTARTHTQSHQVEVVDTGPQAPASANIWHADSTWRRVPPAGAVLQSESAPIYGGDTIWVSMSDVYSSLSVRMQRYLLGLEAIHTLAQNPGFQEKFLTPEGQADYIDILRAKPPVVHPVVIQHPVSGASTLFVNEAYCQRILGVPRAESEMIKAHILKVVAKPEHQFRLTWRSGTVVAWDNCATQHYAVNDYAPHRRRMNRVAFEFENSVQKLSGAS